MRQREPQNVARRRVNRAAVSTADGAAAIRAAMAGKVKRKRTSTRFGKSPSSKR